MIQARTTVGIKPNGTLGNVKQYHVVIQNRYIATTDCPKKATKIHNLFLPNHLRGKKRKEDR